MNLTITLLFYFLFGVGVSAAVLLSQWKTEPGERLVFAICACLFWPLFVPILLAERPTEPPTDVATGDSTHATEATSRDDNPTAV